MALIKCPECGKEIYDTERICPHCGYSRFVGTVNIPQPQNSSKNKSKVAAGILCLFFWGLGVHELYLGSIKRALICIFVNIFVTIISALAPILGLLLVLIPIAWAIRIFVMPQEEFDAKYNAPDSPNTKKGCLIALFLSVFIIPFVLGILAAIALPQYFRAVEKARGAQVISMLDTVSASQQRYRMQNNKFANDFGALDIDLVDKNGSVVKSGNSFEDKDFVYTLRGGGQNANIEALRNKGKYPYIIRKYYAFNKLECEPTNRVSESICKSLGLNTK